MYHYAQTNIQLFNQLKSNGYSDAEYSLIVKAYQSAMPLFAGRFRASVGKTLISHLVGTASILASLRVPIEIVAAGLLHAAYNNGDFGNREKGISDAQRKQLRNAVGKDVEDYIARYTALKWPVDQQDSILSKEFDTISSLDRQILLMRLANELEEYLDNSFFYCSPKKRLQRLKRINENGHLMVEAAQKLGFSTLATKLADEFKKALQNCNY